MNKTANMPPDEVEKWTAVMCKGVKPQSSEYFIKESTVTYVIIISELV